MFPHKTPNLLPPAPSGNYLCVAVRVAQGRDKGNCPSGCVDWVT